MDEESFEVVVNRLKEAARTARRLPPVRVQGYFTVWPEFVRTPFERLAGEDAPVPRFEPTPADVERMLEVIGWMPSLALEQRHLVWMRAECYRWEDIARRFGCCPRTAQRRWTLAIEALGMKLFAR